MAILILILAILWLAAYLTGRWLAGRSGRDWHRDVLAAGLLALACIAYFWRILFGDSYMPADGGDLISFLWPTYRFAAESLRAGTFPLWNPQLYSGAPHVADIQAGFLYPPNLLLFLLVPDFGVKAMEGLSILHLWWAGLGLYVFLRSLRWGAESSEQIGRAAALAGGLAFAFSDALWIHFGNLNYIAVASWLPWVMVCFVRALEGGRQGGKETRKQGAQSEAQPAVNTVHRSPFTGNRSLAWAAVAGLLLGIATLAGHVQATLFIGLGAVIYGLFWLYGEWANGESANQRMGNAEAAASGSRPSRAPLARLVAALAILAGVAFLVAAPVLLPALGLTRYAARAGWTYQEAVGYSLAPPQWIGLLIPGFFGRGPQLHWGPWPRVEAGYLGVLPLVLAALAILARRERRTWTLAGLSLAAFLLALGIYSLPHGWLSVLPGFNLLRAPARFVLLVDFGLATLAGLGLHVLLSPLGEGENWRALGRLLDGLRWGARALLAVVVPLTFAALLLAQDKDPAVYVRVAVAAIAIMLFVAYFLAGTGLLAARKAGWARPRTLAALALALIFLDLASTGAYFDIGSENPAQAFQHPEIDAFLAQEAEPYRIDARTGIDQLWQPNTALLYGLDDVWGLVNPSILASYERYWEGMGSRSSRLYDFLNAEYVLGSKNVELDWNKFELAFDGDPDLNLYRNRDVMPRAQIVHQAQVVASADQAWEAIHRADFDPSAQVVVEQGDAESLPAVAPATGPEAITWQTQGANHLVLQVTATAPGYLVLSEVWYPGWQATAETDGRVERQPVLRANSTFRAIPLWQAGTYRIELRFRPVAWSVGLVLAGVTVLALAVLAVLAWRRR